LAAIAEADRIVLATPVYMWDMAGQLKIMIDRFFSFMNMDYTSKLTQGKKVLWTITQGQPDVDKFRPAFEQHAAMLQFLGFGENKLLIAGGMMMPGDAEANTDAMEKATEMAKWLVAD
jgi:multimeric flavodoxin WrbA